MTSVVCHAAGQAPIDGRVVFADPGMGNCLACHRTAEHGQATGNANVGPLLADMRVRYPDRAQLRSLIWDSGEKLPNTLMPPYGKHRILTDAEIDALVRYLESL